MRTLARAGLLILWFAGTLLPVRAEELTCCGWDEVFIIDLGDRPDGSVTKAWSWRARERTDLPEEFRSLFDTTDECKPVAGGRLLISSSGGGLAVVERPSGRVLWYGRLGNAHSIELLPGERVVAAGSTHETGNRLAVFDLGMPDRILFEDTLYSAHGVVWDEGRELLWALGYDELRAYRLKDWQTNSPTLSLEQKHPLPSQSGHDLSMVPGADQLLLTTNEDVYTFDIAEHSFSAYGPLEGQTRVKGVSVHPGTRRLAFIQAEGENWWSSRVRFLNPAGELLLKAEHLYKVRWGGRLHPGVRSFPP